MIIEKTNGVTTAPTVEEELDDASTQRDEFLHQQAEFLDQGMIIEKGGQGGVDRVGDLTEVRDDQVHQDQGQVQQSLIDCGPCKETWHTCRSCLKKCCSLCSIGELGETQHAPGDPRCSVAGQFEISVAKECPMRDKIMEGVKKASLNLVSDEITAADGDCCFTATGQQLTRPEVAAIVGKRHLVENMDAEIIRIGLCSFMRDSKEPAVLRLAESWDEFGRVEEEVDKTWEDFWTGMEEEGVWARGPVVQGLALYLRMDLRLVFENGDTTVFSGRRDDPDANVGGPEIILGVLRDTTHLRDDDENHQYGHYQSLLPATETNNNSRIESSYSKSGNKKKNNNSNIDNSYSKISNKKKNNNSDNTNSTRAPSEEQIKSLLGDLNIEEENVTRDQNNRPRVALSRTGYVFLISLYGFIISHLADEGTYSCLQASSPLPPTKNMSITCSAYLRMSRVSRKRYRMFFSHPVVFLSKVIYFSQKVLVLLVDDGGDFGLSSETTIHNFGRLFRDGDFEVCLKSLVISIFQCFINCRF